MLEANENNYSDENKPHVNLKQKKKDKILQNKSKIAQ